MAASPNVICFADARSRYRNIRYSVALDGDVDDEAFNFVLDVVTELVSGDVDVDVVGDECILSFVGSLMHREKLSAMSDMLWERGVPCHLASETFSRWASDSDASWEPERRPRPD